MKENNLESKQEGTSLTSSFWNLTQKNKELLDSGTPTLIPFTLPALKKIVPGIIPGEVIILTAGTSTGKSRVVRKMALKDIVNFCQQKGIKVRVFLNSLEETPEKVIATLVNKELHERFGVASSYYKIANYSEESSLTDEQMEKVKLATEIVEEKYGDILEVVKESNPFAFYKKIREYLFSVGKFYYIVKDVNGKVTSKTQVKLGDQWNHYEYNEPTIVVTIFDTIDKAQGYSSTLPNSDVKVTLNQYDAIGKYVHYYVGELLGPVCKVISFIISQQLSDFVQRFVELQKILYLCLYDGYRIENKKVYR
jgi:DnaB-like helicase C terminal domain